MSQSLEKLISQLSGQTPYQAMAQEEIDRLSAARFGSLYAQKRLGAQQSYEAQDAALLRQWDGLAAAFDSERTSAAAQTRQMYAQANRQALSRGMQRSSYNNAHLVNIDLAGAEAIRGIDRRQTAAQDELSSQRTLLSAQLADQLRRYDADEQTDILAYADTLADREYTRSTQSQNTQNEIAMKLYEYRHQLEQEAAEQARWLAEFNAKYGGGSSGGGSGGSKPTKKDTQKSLPKGKPSVNGTKPGVSLLR